MTTHYLPAEPARAALDAAVRDLVAELDRGDYAFPCALRDDLAAVTAAWKAMQRPVMPGTTADVAAAAARTGMTPPDVPADRCGAICEHGGFCTLETGHAAPSHDASGLCRWTS